MNRGPVFVVLAFAFIFQLVAIPLYRIGVAKPDFVFIVFVYLALVARTSDIVAPAVLYSLVLDAFSLNPIGSSVFGLLPTVWIVGRTRGSFWAESRTLRWLVVFPTATLYLFLVGQFVSFFDHSGGASWGLTTVLLSALYTTGLSIVVFELLDQERRRLGLQRAGAFIEGR